MLRITPGARPLAFAVTLGTLLCLSAPLAAAERPWIEVKSPHFTAVSDVGEKPAREMLWNFEQLRAAIHKVWPWAGVDYDRPVLLLLPRGEDGMRELLPWLDERKVAGTPSATFVTGVDRHYVAIRTDTPQDLAKNINPYRPAFSAYAGLAFRTGIARDLPLWIRDGLMSVVSNTYMRESSVDMGRVDTAMLQRNRSGGRLPLADLVATDSLKDWDAARVAMFFAQSWGFTHYLLFGDEGAHRDELSRFLQLVIEGKTSSGAFELAFGDAGKIATAFEHYLNRPTFSYMHLPVDASISRDSFVVRDLLASDAAASRAAYLASWRRPVEARAEITAARAHMAGAPPVEVEGILFDTDRETAKALEAYMQAVQLGSTNFYAYYRAAVLTTARDAASQIKKEQLLERAVALAPRFAPARTMLASLKVDLGRPAEALEHARLAVQLDPGSIGPRYPLASVLWRLNMREDAIRQIREALALARTDGERNLAQSTLDNYLKALAR